MPLRTFLTHLDHDPAASKLADAGAVAGVYNHYITGTTVTFEETEVLPAEIARRIQEVESASLPWLIAERDRMVVGYAYAARWHSRSGYRFSAETGP